MITTQEQLIQEAASMGIDISPNDADFILRHALRIANANGCSLGNALAYLMQSLSQ